MSEEGSDAIPEPAIADGDFPAVPEAVESGMVEKVARALHVAIAGTDPDEMIHHPAQSSWEEPSWRRWEQWDEAARAAIAAMPCVHCGGDLTTGPTGFVDCMACNPPLGVQG